MGKYKVIGKIHHSSNRMVYFAIPQDYDPDGKSIEEVYKASFTFEFDKEMLENYITIKNSMI